MTELFIRHGSGNRLALRRRDHEDQGICGPPLPMISITHYDHENESEIEFPIALDRTEIQAVVDFLSQSL